MKRVSLIIITLFIAINNISAQTKTAPKLDVIIKTNGDEMKGKITKINDDGLQFIYAGETLEYSVKKSDILRIIHSSGRVEIFNQPVQPAPERKKDEVTMAASPVDHHNKIAILPFGFLMDRQPGSEEVGFKAQDDTYAYLVQHSAGYNILDTRTTNALLIKNGMTGEKMRSFTMKEICDVLGVEYLVSGTVIQNKGAQTSSSSGYGDTKVKRDGDNKVKGVSTYGSTNSYSQQRYEVSVGLGIYMDTNASIYNQTHKAFFTNTNGSYSSPLEYLLKRCPLYRK
ncbi:FlgO family outer membrane protein [Mucilaginibacter sp.]|uniref:FlgO family outer membrane protein n=1 Tax=Mucilaginibacter sp. TaxID=1882438 RepID=UPI0025FE012D|nr:FlgO family outer membrane protein [Mucilaginibacter sp.]